jgi:hypothetical protein
MTDEELQAIQARLEAYHVCVPGTDEDLYAHASTDIAALIAEVKAVRNQRDVAVKDREAALDCHPGDGVSFCGSCISCWARVHDRVIAERDRYRASMELAVSRLVGISMALGGEWDDPEGVAEAVAKMRAERDAAQAVLVSLEWSGTDSITHRDCCPKCRRLRRHGVHTPDCALAAAKGGER